jgi:pyruvoyl-dependent arginine decarboxylase (PvlArgDC)
MEYSARGQAEDVERIVRSMAEEALKYRGYEIAEILSTSVQHRVESSGAAFAGVVLCE